MQIGSCLSCKSPKKIYLYTLKQRITSLYCYIQVVNRFKKNVSLHVETTSRQMEIQDYELWIALKKMYLYTLKQHRMSTIPTAVVVNRFKKNVSLHVETTSVHYFAGGCCCESL